MLRRIALLTMFPLLLVLLSLGAGGPASAQTGLFTGQNIASDTYYRLNPEEGTITARVEARVQNATGAPLAEAIFLIMPGAENISVQMDGADVEHERLLDNAALDDPIIAEFVESEYYTVDFIIATPERPMVPNVEHRFTVSYTLGTTQNEIMSIEPGAIESAFVSQGPGSFVYIDLPSDGDNYLDPGCLLAANQPSGLADEGYERWICGETTLIAFASESESVQSDCAAAAPRCRQKLEVGYSAFGQSITNPDLRGELKGTTEMQNGTVTIEFRFFKRDAEWAREQFDIALLAFPKLEQLFGFAYPSDSLVLRQSNFIDFAGAAGLAFPTLGELLLINTENYGYATDQVTVHELAHQWAGHQLAAPWTWEGLADYSSRIVSEEMGLTLAPFLPWDEYGVAQPLVLWGWVEPFDPGYWYSRSEAFFFALEEEIGGRSNMTLLLGQIGAEEENWPLRERWFQDRAEAMFDVNLDALFLEWMYVPQTAEPLLAERRAVWGEVAELEARAATLGLPGVPLDIRQDLDAWEFVAARARLTEAHGLLDTYAGVLAKANANSMPRADTTIRDGWMNRPLHQMAELVRLKEHAIDAIVAARTSLSVPGIPEASLLALDAAVTLYEEGSFSAAATAATSTVNQLSLTREAEALLIEAETRDIAFQPNFFERVGLLGSDPSSDLDRARTALEEGNPQESIRLSHAALDGWDGAQAGGALRLAITAGLLCLAIVAVYFAGTIKRAPAEKKARSKATKPQAEQSGVSPEFRAFLDKQSQGKGKTAEGPAGLPAPDGNDAVPPGGGKRSMRTHGTLRQQLRNNRSIQGDEQVPGGGD